MKKYYKVSLYNIIDCFGHFEYVDNIVVQKSIFGTSELLTTLFIDVIDAKTISMNKQLAAKRVLIREQDVYGMHLFVKKQDFVQKNLATEKDIDDWVERYDTSSFKTLYEKRKCFSQEEKGEIQIKTKKVEGTKR